MTSHKGHGLFLFVLVVLAIAELAGCSRNGGRLPLSGIVTLDGRPLADAAISFQPAIGNAGPSSGASVDTNGNFSIPADSGLLPGKYVVVIQKWKGTGRTFKDPRSGKPVEITAPISFKEADKLAATVAADGQNRFEFHLTSAK
jgi:hypothetical protein